MVDPLRRDIQKKREGEKVRRCIFSVERTEEWEGGFKKSLTEFQNERSILMFSL